MTRTPQPRPPGRPRTTPQLVVSQAKTAAEEPVAPDSDDDVPAGPPPSDAMSEMLAGLQGAANSRISIYRVVKNQPPSWVAECDPTSFSLEELRDKYRGGEFRLYIMKDGRLWKNMRIFVEPPVTAPIESAAPSSQLGDLLTVMREGFAAQAAALREATTVRPPSPFANMDLPAVITAVTGALVALRPPPPPPAPPPAADVDFASKSIDMFMKGLELARDLKEDASPADNSIGGMLRTVLGSPLMAQAVAAATPQPHPPQPRPALAGPQQPQAQTQPQPQPQPQAQTQPTQPEASDVNMLHYYYGLLCQKAAAGADPTLYAEMVLDNVDDDTLNTLLTKQPTPLDALIAEYPAAAPHREWFGQLIDVLMSAMTEEEPPSDVPQPINGAHPDAAHVPPPVVPGQPS